MGQGVSQFGCVPYQCNDRGEHHYAEAKSEYLSAGGGAWSTPCGEVQKHANQPWMIGGGVVFCSIAFDVCTAPKKNETFRLKENVCVCNT